MSLPAWVKGKSMYPSTGSATQEGLDAEETPTQRWRRLFGEPDTIGPSPVKYGPDRYVPEYALRKERPEAELFDLDGTVTSSRWRENYVEGQAKNWEAFHTGMVRDQPIPDTVAKMKAARDAGKKVIVLSLRPERYRKEIRKYLDTHDIPYDAIFLRPEGSQGVKGDEMKKVIYQRQISRRFDVKKAYDDYDLILAMWDSLGVPTEKVIDPELDPDEGPVIKDPRITRIFVKPYVQTREGNIVHVDGYWRYLSAVEALELKIALARQRGV